MSCNIPNELERDIILFAGKHDIGKVVLFGSRARGTNRERSDVDLAVCGGDFTGFCLDVKENARSLLTVDVVDLSLHISDALKAEIERDGITIYEKA